jgi:hypothetical protein
MKPDLIPFSRSRELWEIRRPPPSDERPAVGTRAPTVTKKVPAHLVLTNNAGDREDVLLGVAGWLAEQTGCSTRVAHVFSPPPVGELENVRRLAPTDHGGSVAEMCDRVVRLARTLAVRTGRPTSPEMLTGSIDPTLTDYLRTNAFDLVTAATGRTWPALWGCRVWYRVARVRPVVVVGPGASHSWLARARSTREVLALLDGTAGAERIVAPAGALCRLLDARLTLLRVVPRGGGSTDRYLLDVADRIRHDVPAVRAIAMPGAPADAALAAQRATDAVVALCAPASAPVAAWGPGRLAARLIRASAAPVLFHRPAL